MRRSFGLSCSIFLLCFLNSACFSQVKPEASADPFVTQNQDGTRVKSPTKSSQTPIVTASLNESTESLSKVADQTSPAPGPLLVRQVLASKPTIKPTMQQKRLWTGLLIAEHSAALFDAWSTRQSLSSGNGYERDPLLKPFANSGAVYPALQVAPLGADFLAHRLLHSNNRLLRRSWWLPQALSLGASAWCGARNLHVADLKR